MMIHFLLTIAGHQKKVLKLGPKLEERLGQIKAAVNKLKQVENNVSRNHEFSLNISSKILLLDCFIGMFVEEESHRIYQ